MSIKINYSKDTLKKPSSNLVLFCDEKFSINKLKKNLSSPEYSYISDLLKNSDLKKNIFVFELNAKRKIVLISIKNNLRTAEIEKLGGELHGRINYGKNSTYFIDSDTAISKKKNFISHFLHGLKLKSYEFDKYKSKKTKRLISIFVLGKKNKPSLQTQIKFKALEEGTFYARDLVSEPGNVLHPDEYAKRLNSLRKDGLKINVYDEKKLNGNN